MVGPEAAPLPEPILWPLRLPTTIVQVTPYLGRFWLRGGSLARRDYADRQRAQLARLNPVIEAERHGRLTEYQLLAGLFANVE